MDLGYLQRLSIRTAGRVDFGERVRPAGRFDGEREVLERAANALDELAREPGMSTKACRAVEAATLELMRAGY